MFRGYNKPRKTDIFGPSATGGRFSNSRERQLYQEGEGFGSFISSLFKKIVPIASKTIKKIAGSKIVKDTGKQLADSAITGLTNVASDLVSGDKTLDESFSEQLSTARRDIATAIKESNRKRKKSEEDEDLRTKGNRKKKGKGRTVSKKRKVKRSVFDDDYN